MIKYYLLVVGLLSFTYFPSFAQKVSSDDLLKQAIEATNVKKDYPMAIELAKQGLKISPDYIDIKVLLGRLYILTEKNEQAISLLQEVLNKHPDHADALGYIINASYQGKNYNEAVRYASQYLNYYPSDKSIRLKKISILTEMQDFKRSRDEVQSAIKKYPGDPEVIYLYKEVLFSTAKGYFQKQDTLSALNTYKELLNNYPADTTARNLLINLQTDTRNYQGVINDIDAGMPYYTDKQGLLLKKLSILQEMNNNDAAYQLSQSINKAYPENRSIRTINNELFLLTRQNQIGIGYAVTAFDQQGKTPWSVYSAAYHRTEKYGTLIGRVNYANRIESKGYQFEIEAYPSHEKSYSFVNFSYSNSIVFPRFRFSYSYFMPLSKSWETEIGIRYQRNDEDFLSYTTALGKYLGKYWLNLKVFLTPNEGKIANSYTLTGRYYLNDLSDDYVTVIAGYGFSPDDRGRNFEISNRINMESIRFTLGYQRTLWGRNILGMFGTWNNQKYEQGVKRNEYDASVTFRHKF